MGHNCEGFGLKPLRRTSISIFHSKIPRVLMASLLKLRSVAARTSTLLLPKNIPSGAPFCSPPAYSARNTIVSMSRVVVTIGCGESLLPLHSAVAATRLRSNIGVNSASWSCLSQGLTLTL